MPRLSRNRSPESAASPRGETALVSGPCFRSPVRALIWKEWKEQRWKIAYGCTLMTGICLVNHVSRMMEMWLAIGLLIPIGGFLLPLLAAVSVTATDREDGSLGFALCMPAKASVQFSVRLLSALAACLTPLFVTMVLCLPLIGPDVSLRMILGGFASISWVAVNVVVWAAILGMKQPTEARAAAVGIIVLFVLLVCPSVLDPLSRLWVQQWLEAFHPFIVLDWESLQRSGRVSARLVRALLVQSAMLALLWGWGQRRFACLAGGRS